MKAKILIGILFVLASCLEDQGPTQAEQLLKDVKQIDDFLAANPPASSDLIVKDASGIRLVISELGSGAIPPNNENELVASYTGRLFSNGQIFDSRPTNDPFYFTLGGSIIDGWKIGFSLLTEGAKAKLYIPSIYAYGSNGNGTIPKNAILVFDVELMSVEPTDTQVAKLASDVAAIDVALEGTPNVTNHESGLRYLLQPIGTGSIPTLYDQVRIKFSGKLLSDNTVFQPEIEQAPNGGFSSRVVNYLHGLIIGMQQMHEGDKATFYIPSTLAFGPVSINGVPANSNVIIEVELLEVIDE